MKNTHLLIITAIILVVAAILAVILLAGASDTPPQPPLPSENISKVTAAPGTVILLRPGVDGVNYSAILNTSSHVTKDQDIENYLWNKAAEYDRSINGYGVNEIGYLTIFLETYYSPEEPEKILAAIDKISAAKKIPPLPVQFIIPEIDISLDISDEYKHNASVTEERLTEILQNIIASQPPENKTKVTAAPGTLILIRPGVDGVNYSTMLNASGYTTSDPDINSHLRNKVTEYDRNISDYGVNETGYLTILLEGYYSPEEPEKVLAEIDRISAAKKNPPLPVQFMIVILDYQIELSENIKHNTTVTEERLEEILRNIEARTA
ncbi:hypothetical protein [Methanorbis rubei]|uniref:Uncharacterized protein n=1 Tax=Methanorbis rubei TaxID=3028300 RepID=A0AAE4MHJ6_9EURY|nr:hypothetical protein [Methanocorpusculaceae archaeon Cs1]